MDYAGRSNLCAHELVYLGQDQLKPKYKGQGHSGRPLNPETPLQRRKDKMGGLFLKKEQRKEDPKHTFGWRQAKSPPAKAASTTSEEYPAYSHSEAELRIKSSSYTAPNPTCSSHCLLKFPCQTPKLPPLNLELQFVIFSTAWTCLPATDSQH